MPKVEARFTPAASEGENMADDIKHEYEEPNLTDFGTIENVTQGSVVLSLTDAPLGAAQASPTTEPTPGSGAL